MDHTKEDDLEAVGSVVAVVDEDLVVGEVMEDQEEILEVVGMEDVDSVGEEEEILVEGALEEVEEDSVEVVNQVDLEEDVEVMDNLVDLVGETLEDKGDINSNM